MSEKWTKEQIAFAKAILKWHGCGSEEDSCQCYFSNGKCPFLTGNGIGPSYEKFSGEHAQLIKKLIAQHEHDADIVPPEGYSGVTTSAEGQNIPSPANMSVHDYWRYQFAGMAMQGIVMHGIEATNKWGNVMAIFASEYADKLLKRLEEKK